MLQTEAQTLIQSASGADLPAPYLEAVAECESGGNPRAVSPTGAAGLFQISMTVAKEWGQAHGFATVDRLDIRQNVAMAAWHFRRILAAHKKAGLAHSWANLTHVGILTLGYTAGWSEVQGTAFLIRKVGPAKATVDTLISAAKATFPKSAIYNTGGGYMSAPVLRAHVLRVVQAYTANLGRAAPVVGPVAPVVPVQAGLGFEPSGWLLLAGMLAGGAAYLLSRTPSSAKERLV
jgi:hypothetical protein